MNTAGGQRRGHLDEGEQRLLNKYAQQVEPAVVGQHHAQPVARLQPPPIIVTALAQGFDVTHPSRWSHQNPSPGQMGAPAKVGVFTLEGHGLVEPAQRPQQIGPDKETGAGDEEHVTYAVVLFLVELAPFAQREGGTETIGAHAHVQQRFWLVPAHQLGADHARVGSVGLLHQEPHGVGSQGDVVVADQEERRPLDHGEGDVYRRPRSTVGLEPTDVGTRGDFSNSVGGVVVTFRVDDEDGEVGILLVDQGSQRFLEPRAGVMGDDHGDHGGQHNSRRTRHIDAIGDGPPPSWVRVEGEALIHGEGRLLALSRSDGDHPA